MTEHLPRRRLLNWLLSTSAGGLFAVLGYPLMRFVIPPEDFEEGNGTLAVGQLEDFPPNSARIVRLGNRPAMVIRTPGGDFRAFVASCTHLQCTVAYHPDQGRVVCACHNGVFDLDGRNIDGPPPRPLDPLAVAVHGNRIILGGIG